MPQTTAQKPTVTDAISTLYANIRFAERENPIRSIAITSATAGEGKSFIALQLAKAMAQSGKKTLLVDANCHAPVLAGQLGVTAARGIAEIVASEADLSEAVSGTKTTDLAFLNGGSGLAAPADLFGTDAFAEMVKGVSAAYDYMIFDTPALDPYIDAAVLASVVDATVLVVRQHAVSRDAVAAACDQLGKAHAHVIGVALNDCED